MMDIHRNGRSLARPNVGELDAERRRSFVRRAPQLGEVYVELEQSLCGFGELAERTPSLRRWLESCHQVCSALSVGKLSLNPQRSCTVLLGETKFQTPIRRGAVTYCTAEREIPLRFESPLERLQ